MLNDIRLDAKDELFHMVRILAKQKLGLKVIHINAQSLNNKMDEFRYNFVNSGIDIICVSETWFHPAVNDSIYNLPGYSLYRADRESNAGGACVYIRNNIKCKLKLKSDYSSPIEFIFLEVNTEYKDTILLGSVYRPNRYVPLDSLISSVNSLSAMYSDVIIAGDFNSNIMVESLLTDEFLALGLQPTNTNTPTHYHRTSNSLLDIFLVNSESKVILYDQLSASMFSNHDLIFMSYDTNVDTNENSIRYRDFNNINYSLVNELVDTVQWESMYEIESVDEQTEFLQSNINELYEVCVPLKTKILRYNQQPWFNDDIKRAISYRNSAYKRWKRYKTSSLHELFKSARRNVVNLIHRSKRAFYRIKFANAIDNKTKWKEIRNIGIGKRNVNIINADINVNQLNQIFIGDSITDNGSSGYSDYSYVRVENEFGFRCVEQDEVFKSLMSIKSNAVGLDGIDPKFLKIILAKVLPYISYLFNSVLTKSVFPNAWKTAKILPVIKSNNEYRPISILSFLAKALEKLIYSQMIEYLYPNGLLSNRQSGFRKHRSCITALTDVVEDLRSSLEENMVSFLVLLDHSKAFDTVNHNNLIIKLEKLFYFSQPACKLIASYIKGRKQAVYVNNDISDALDINRGVPQGSILGPLLFCIYVNDLPDVIHHSKIQIYADDVQLYLSSLTANIDNCIHDITDDLQAISIWANANGLCINPTKSKFLYISKRRQVPDTELSLRINNSNIKCVKSCANLGIIFNNELSWSNHINITAGKVHGMLRNLWAVQSSTPIQIRMLLVKTYLIPTLLYGCEIFSNCDSTDFRKLQVTFNNITRYVFSKRRSDRISAFSYQIYNMSFQNYLKYKCLIFLHKIIYTKEPNYLFDRINFARSKRGKKLIQLSFKYSKSEMQFFIPTIRLWNTLPPEIQTISNVLHFKRELGIFLK